MCHKTSSRFRLSRLAELVFVLVAGGSLRAMAQEPSASPESVPPAPVVAPASAPPPAAPVGAPLPAPVAIEPAPSQGSFLVGSLSAGLGIPYGVLGAGVAVGTDYISLTGGVGTSVMAGAGYSAGLRIHFLDTSHRFRPHVSAVYGTTAAYEISGVVHMTGVLHGFGFYGGFDHDFGNHGGWFATYGLGYITHEGLPQSVKDTLARYSTKEPSMGAPIKFMVGVGYLFGGR